MSDKYLNEARGICARHGVDELGACRVATLDHEETATAIRKILPDAKTILVLLKRIPQGMIGQAYDLPYQQAALATFEALGAASAEIVGCLMRHGVGAAWPGRQKTPHQKRIAVRAGLGSIGVSALFVSSRHGIDVHLETVVVGHDIDISADEPARFACNRCGRCMAACPAGAILDKSVDREKCMAYRRTSIPPFEGRRYCGLCMKACPQRLL
jgi:ferredoxin